MNPRRKRDPLAIDRVAATDALLVLLQKLGLCSMKQWGYMPSASFVRRIGLIESDRGELRYE
jgi:hypothetical protein